jgi:iron complex transport system ATP-binding protein
LVSLRIENLAVSHGAHSVIRGVSDLWPNGQVTALIGCNGAGKSTFLQALAGLLPAQGHLVLDDVRLSPNQRRRQIAYMPQYTSAHSSLTVLEVVLLGRLGRLGLRLPADLVEDAQQMLAAFNLSALQARQLDEISGGQRQLVFLAQALFRKPRVLLLDEPTAALDLRHQLIVLEKLRQVAAQEGTVIGVAMHDLNLAAQYADRMIGLWGGHKVSAGAPGTVLTPDTLRKMYAIEAEVSVLQGGRLSVFPLRPQ